MPVPPRPPIAQVKIVSEDLPSKLALRCGKEFVVALEDGFGNREWLWFPPFPQENSRPGGASWRTSQLSGTSGHARTGPANSSAWTKTPELSRLWASLWKNGPVRARVEMNEQLDLAAPETTCSGRTEPSCCTKERSGSERSEPGAFDSSAEKAFRASVPGYRGPDARPANCRRPGCSLDFKDECFNLRFLGTRHRFEAMPMREPDHAAVRSQDIREHPGESEFGRTLDQVRNMSRCATRVPCHWSETRIDNSPLSLSFPTTNAAEAI